MSDAAPQSTSAFSKEYRAILRARDEPDAPWSGDATKPVVILSTQGGFGLFRAWQSPEAGDVPLAVFTDLMDARLAALAHFVIRRDPALQPPRAADPARAGKGMACSATASFTGGSEPSIPNGSTP